MIKNGRAFFNARPKLSAGIWGALSALVIAVAALTPGSAPSPQPVMLAVSLPPLPGGVRQPGPPRVLTGAKTPETGKPGAGDHNHGTPGPKAGPPPPKIGEDGSLPPVPDLGLIEEYPDGFLPRIGRDGRRPDQVYARPFDQTRKGGRIAIVLRGVGPYRAAAEHAIMDLPPEIVLSFATHARDLQTLANQARARGHEVMLDLPMEPFDFPVNDPGPDALLTGLPSVETERRLAWHLSRFTGYTGVVNLMGGKVMAAKTDFSRVLNLLGKRGLTFLDTGSSDGSLTKSLKGHVEIPLGVADRQIDRVPNRSAIKFMLKDLENLAMSEGAAIGVARALPVTVEVLAAWARSLPSRGLVLAPLSAIMMKKQPPTSGPLHEKSGHS